MVKNIRILAVILLLLQLLSFGVAAQQAVSISPYQIEKKEICIQFSEPISVMGTVFGTVTEAKSGRSVPCVGTAEGETLRLRFMRGLLPDREYLVFPKYVVTASGESVCEVCSFWVTGDLLPLTEPVFTKGDGEISVSRFWKNTTSVPTDFSAVLGLYQGKQLSDLSVEPVLIPAKTAIRTENMLALDSIGENAQIKQFFWKNLNTLTPIVSETETLLFSDETVSSEEPGKYVIAYQLPFPVSYGEMTKEHFSLQKCTTGETVGIEKVAYFPMGNFVKLYISGVSADNRGFCLTFLGESLSFSDIVFPSFYFPEQTGEPTITEITYYDETGYYYGRPEQKELFVTVTIENRSGKAYENQMCRIYSEEALQNLVFEERISLPAEGSGTVQFRVPNPSWRLWEKLHIAFEE